MRRQRLAFVLGVVVTSMLTVVPASPAAAMCATPDTHYLWELTDQPVPDPGTGTVQHYACNVGYRFVQETQCAAVSNAPAEKYLSCLN